MTTLDHIERVKALAKTAAGAAEWDAQDDTPPKVCHCPTCGVVNYRLRAEMLRRGWSRSAVHHINVEGSDLRGGHAHLAVVRVNGQEVYRIHSNLEEALEETVLYDIDAALRRHGC